MSLMSRNPALTLLISVIYLPQFTGFHASTQPTLLGRPDWAKIIITGIFRQIDWVGAVHIHDINVPEF